MSRSSQSGGPGAHCDPEDFKVRAAARDPKLLEDLFACYQADLKAYLQRRCGDPNDADDALQDTFVNALRYLEGYRGEAAIRNWLYRLASSACTRMHRGIKGDRSRHGELEEGVIPAGGITRLGALTPLEAKEAVDSMLEARLAPIQKALESLGETNQAVLLLRDGEGMSTREVADSLGLSESAVRTRLHRARKSVRERLGGDDDDAE